MLLAEELALVALRPEAGRHGLGNRSQLNAALGGLLVAELVLAGLATAPAPDRVIVVKDHPAPSVLLRAVAEVVDEKGPKIKAALSDLDRGLHHRLGVGTWDAVLAGLVDDGVLATPTGGLMSHTDLTDLARRDDVVARLRAAVADDGPLDLHTALVLSMTGPAQLLEVVAPERAERRHARRRIDHALDETPFASMGKIVRRLLAEAATMVATA